MTAKKTTKRFYVDAKIKVDTNLIINAATLEDAIVEARKLTVTDFITFAGDHIDSDLEITGLFQSD